MKMVALSTLFCLIASQAIAQTVISPPCTDKFKGLPALAKRLNIKAGDQGGLLLRTCEGKEYDVFALLNAMLDRMDKLSKAMPKPPQ